MAVLAYCGTPPVPDELWARWNFDPALMAVLLVLGGVYALGAARLGRSLAASDRLLFGAGWAVAALALISPLCALSVALFAARAAQHMALALVAAPLVAAGRPGAAFAAALGRPAGSLPARPVGAALLFAGALWFWHAPGPYAATFSSTAAYWAMHGSVLASALWLWSALLARGQALAAALVGVASSVQMGLLGALITLAPRPLYAPHALSTAAWGLTPLQDQQLGGGIMWIPGCVAFLAVATIGLRGLLAEPALHRAAAR